MRAIPNYPPPELSINAVYETRRHLLPKLQAFLGFLKDGGIPGLGMVPFSNERAEMYSVMYGPMTKAMDVAGANQVAGAADLGTWFREVMFPPAFESLLPGSTVLRGEAGEFEGQAAWIAIVHMPRGHVMVHKDFGQAWLGEKGRRMDSWCGIVVIRHRDHGYILMKELNDQVAATASSL